MHPTANGKARNYLSNGQKICRPLCGKVGIKVTMPPGTFWTSSGSIGRKGRYILCTSITEACSTRTITTPFSRNMSFSSPKRANLCERIRCDQLDRNIDAAFPGRSSRRPCGHRARKKGLGRRSSHPYDGLCWGGPYHDSLGLWV